MLALSTNHNSMKTMAKYHVCNPCVIGEKTFKNKLTGRLSVRPFAPKTSSGRRGPGRSGAAGEEVEEVGVGEGETTEYEGPKTLIFGSGNV